MSAGQWWETFFDEAYVEAWAEGGFFARSDEDAAAVAALLAGAPGDEVLDVGCGFGRIAGPLHDRGFRVTGIDVSGAQLRLAEEHNPGPRYLQGDMRRPPEGPFDAVVNVFSSFGYFDDRGDDIAALRAWARVLRPGGVLVMDLVHRDFIAHVWKGDDEVIERGATRETGVTDWVTGRRTSTLVSGGVTKTFTVRLYSATELIAELTSAGFATIEVHGDLAASAPLAPTSRLVVRAVR